MAAKVLLRALAYRYIRRGQQNGPFLLQLDDLHASNMFVDNDGNVTCLLDLEFVNAMPVERMGVPYWLAGHPIDGLQQSLSEFDQVRKEFMGVFEEEEEAKFAANHGLPLANIMRETWESGGFWFWHCIMSVNAMLVLFMQHISPRSTPLTNEGLSFVSEFWDENVSGVVHDKLGAFHQYTMELEHLFTSSQ